MAVRQPQRHAGIKTDTGLADDQRVVGEADVEGGVAHLQQLVRLDRMRAEGAIVRCLVDVEQACIGLQPLAVGIDQTEQRDRHTADQ